MNNVMTNGFCELNENEMMMVDGGMEWGRALGGAGVVVTCIGVAAAATGPVGWIAAAALCGASALGGAAIGSGFTH